MIAQAENLVNSSNPPAVSGAVPIRGNGPWLTKPRAVWALCILFALSLPLANPYVHGDGVGYYAYARALLIQHDLNFEQDWLRANQGFAQARVGADGRLSPDEYTETGHINNYFTIGPAILWSPFLASAHVAVLISRMLGASIPADGFSWPYRMAMAVGTVGVGFLSLLLSYALVSEYVESQWAFLATLGIWTASALPVYMYFNPSWSHAHSAFVVALFLWFWNRSRPERTLGQWIVLGLCGGLMITTYFPNGVLLVIPLLESLGHYFHSLRTRNIASALLLLCRHAAFAATLLLALLPTFVTRAIVFGSPFRFGNYGSLPWDWSAPHRWEVLFSSNHGLLSWTPLLALAVAGLFFANGRGAMISAYCGIAALAFYYVIASYPYWDGMASFSNRFFVSLSPIFILGLAQLLQFIGRSLPRRAGTLAASSLLAIAALWNAGFIFQWGTQMIPARGTISWKEVAQNQFIAVPERLSGEVDRYLFRRNTAMQSIEVKDLQRRSSEARNPQP